MAAFNHFCILKCWQEEENTLKGNLPEEGDGRMEKFKKSE
jgi:hypothetical protein